MKRPTPQAERVIPADVRAVIVHQLGAALAAAWRLARADMERDHAPTAGDAARGIEARKERG